jgi:general secretion pathway protein B
MSLILEALKKSEDKRRLGAAPDLATPFSAPRRRKWVWPIAAVLVAAGLIVWALRPSTPPPSPAATAAPPKANVAAVQVAPTLGQKTGGPLHSVTGTNDQVQTAPPSRLPKPPPALGMGGRFVPGQPDANEPVAEPPKTGREIFQAMRRHGAEVAANNEREVARAAAQTPRPSEKPLRGAGAARRATAAAPPRVAAATPPPGAASAASVAVSPPAVATTSPPKMDAASTATAGRAPKSPSTVGLMPTPSAPAAQPAKAAPVSSSSAQPYAELPFGVRKSMPELRLSMHVYAADPSHRFVMLNDSRLTEGEKTSDEIFVREIRPDGVVLEFQNQRFFYPRDGL